VNRGITVSELELLAKEIKNNLFKKGIDKFLIFANSCRGCVTSWDYIQEKQCRCSGKARWSNKYGSLYLVWPENNVYYIQMIDCCWIYSKHKIYVKNIFKYISTHKEKIKTEEIIPRYIESHFFFTAIYYYDKKDSLELQLKDGVFRESNDAFYEYNKKLKVKKLKDIVDEKIKYIKKNYTFEKLYWTKKYRKMLRKNKMN